MSRILSNLPRPLRSRAPCGPSAASGWQPSVFSPSPAMKPSPNVVGSLVPAPSQGRGVNEDPFTLMEPLRLPPEG